MTYLVIGYVPDNPPDAPGAHRYRGVHTPLRSDGHYGSLDMAIGVAALWRTYRMHDRERVVVVSIVDEDASQPRGA